MKYTLQVPDSEKKIFADFKAKCLYEEADLNDALLSLIKNGTGSKGLQARVVEDKLEQILEHMQGSEQKVLRIEEKLNDAEMRAKQAEIERATLQGELKRVRDLEMLVRSKDSEIRALKKNLHLLEQKPLNKLLTAFNQFINREPQPQLQGS